MGRLVVCQPDLNACADCGSLSTVRDRLHIPFGDSGSHGTVGSPRFRTDPTFCHPPTTSFFILYQQCLLQQVSRWIYSSIFTYFSFAIENTSSTLSAHPCASHFASSLSGKLSDSLIKSMLNLLCLIYSQHFFCDRQVSLPWGHRLRPVRFLPEVPGSSQGQHLFESLSWQSKLLFLASLSRCLARLALWSLRNYWVPRAQD